MGSKNLIGMVIGFFVATAMFFVIERLGRGIKDQKVMRRGFWTDILYWFFTPLVTKGITRAALILPAVLLVVITGISVEQLKNPDFKGFGPLSLQPLWLQGIEVFLIGDFIGYWSHRWFHGARLWPFHAVHHSSVEVDWLSSVRLHPVNDLVSKMAHVFPLLFFGFNPYVLASYAPVLTFYSVLLHANVNWDYGPLRSVIASPVFHRWHHTKEEEGLDKNFAGFFPFLDILFGTYYMPRGRQPTVFGISDPMPNDLLGQLIYPFRSHKQPDVEVEVSKTGAAENVNA